VYKKGQLSGHIIHFLLFFIFLISHSNAFAQKKRTINILNAETLEYDDALGLNVQRLKGDVQFENKGMLLFCDSAYFYPSNFIEAFGKVHANKGDSINLFSNELKFDGDQQLAIAIGEVRLTDREMTLTTDELNFNIKENTASYYTGGKIINKENILTSKRGHYNSRTKIFSFKDSVNLTNPEYEMITDTLQFNTITEIAYFMGSTTIISEESTIYTEKGWYNTQTDKSELSLNNRLTTKEQTLDADSILYNRHTGLAKAFDNIVISDTANKITITGNIGQYNQKTQRSYVTDRATMIQAFEEDSLFLHADSLWVYRDTLEEQNEIYAYYNSRFYKPDLQGVCDSLVYIQKDSLIRMYREPILWSEKNQITGEYMELLIFDGEIKELHIDKDAFIISSVDTLHYNQIKGREMRAIFKDNEMERIYVNGNGQTIYFAEDENKKPKKKIIGVNNLDCSNIVVYVKNSDIHSMTFLDQPNGVMTPIKKADPAKMRLKGFILKTDEKPLSKEDIYLPRD
jgi:lipopolysaccharide export system protein LptA